MYTENFIKVIWHMLYGSVLILFGASTSIIFLWKMLVINSPELVVPALWIISITVPIMALMIIFRWLYKWPMPVGWFDVALVAAALTAGRYCWQALLFLYGHEQEAGVLFWLSLPIVVVLIAFTCYAAWRWYYSRGK